MAIRKVNTATLIRGKVYTLRHPDSTPQNPKDSLRFEKGIPVIIDEAHILTHLENLSEEVGDGEGEFYDKPTFRIDRGVDAPDGEGSHVRKVTRLSPSRTVKKKITKR